jgi:hypothetical protein
MEAEEAASSTIDSSRGDGEVVAITTGTRDHAEERLELDHPFLAELATLEVRDRGGAVVPPETKRGVVHLVAQIGGEDVVGRERAQHQQHVRRGHEPPPAEQAHGPAGGTRPDVRMPPGGQWNSIEATGTEQRALRTPTGSNTSRWTWSMTIGRQPLLAMPGPGQERPPSGEEDPERSRS